MPDLEDSLEILHRRRVVSQIGLYGVALNGAQESAIDDIAALTTVADTPRPLDGISEANRLSVCRLMQSLPTTREIERFVDGKPC